jgi:hypothetical protein
MPTIRNLTIAFVVASGFVLPACGDDVEPLSKADFITQADAICATADAEINPIFDEAYAAGEDVDFEDPEQQQALIARLADAIDEAAPIWSDMASDLRALAPPDADKDTIDAMIDDLDAALDLVTTTYRNAANGDEEAIALLEDESGDPFSDANQQARDYGLVECGSEE